MLFRNETARTSSSRHPDCKRLQSAPSGAPDPAYSNGIHRCSGRIACQIVALAVLSRSRFQATSESAEGSRVYRSMTKSPLLGKKVIDGQVLPCSDSQSTWFLTFRFESGEPECYLLSREVLTRLQEQALAAGAFRSSTGTEGGDTQTGRRKTDQ